MEADLFGVTPERVRRCFSIWGRHKDRNRLSCWHGRVLLNMLRVVVDFEAHLAATSSDISVAWHIALSFHE